MEYLRAKKLEKGSTFGIITPSSPGYRLNQGLFDNGVANLKKLGFNVKLGKLTTKRATQGYRSGTPRERAEEFMDLIRDDEVDAIM